MSATFDGDELPPAAYAMALACLPGVGPGWLVAVLADRSPRQAWEAVVAGALGPPGRARPKTEPMAWARAAARSDVKGQWERCQRAAIAVCWPGRPGYPAVLQEGPAPAGVLFSAGTVPDLGQRRRVAIVGTRRCTPEGADIAYSLGYDLAAAGVCVVSGLALGIDGAAHAGALAAGRDAGEAVPGAGRTVGVAASGVDVVYPPQHTGLWREVVKKGVVLSETPPGQPAQAWRFPSRNRLIAGLAEMVVVVECHVRGGSWHTVEAAIRRGVEVGAVPGSVRSAASVGTNRLLHEGATPVRDAQDVLDALGIFDDAAGATAPVGRERRRGLPPSEVVASALGTPPGPSPTPGPTTAAAIGAMDQVVLGAIAWRPLCLDEVVERSGLPVTAVVVSLERLEDEGVVAGEAGWWVRKSRSASHLACPEPPSASA
jgi:DNA processing protein